MKYWAVFTKTGDETYSAFIPDIPSCVAIGKDPADAQKRILIALETYKRGIGDAPLPEPRAVALEISLDSHGY